MTERLTPEAGICLVKHLATDYKPYIRDEMISEGLVALTKAMQTWDENRGVPEQAYVCFKVRNTMRELLRRQQGYGKVKREEVSLTIDREEQSLKDTLMDEDKYCEHPRVELNHGLGVEHLVERLNREQQEVISLFRAGHGLCEIGVLRRRYPTSGVHMFNAAVKAIKRQVKARRFRLFRSVHKTPIMST